jgi:hypothetical protein
MGHQDLAGNQPPAAEQMQNVRDQVVRSNQAGLKIKRHFKQASKRLSNFNAMSMQST